MHGMQRCAARFKQHTFSCSHRETAVLAQSHSIREKIENEKGKHTAAMRERATRQRANVHGGGHCACARARLALPLSTLGVYENVLCVFLRKILACHPRHRNTQKEKQNSYQKSEISREVKKQKRKIGRKFVFKFTQVVASSLTSFTIKFDSLARASQSLATSIKITRKKKGSREFLFVFFSLSLIFFVCVVEKIINFKRKFDLSSKRLDKI